MSAPIDDGEGPLAPLHHGCLDAAGVRTWGAELITLASVQEVRTRGGPTSYSRPATLAQALDLLATGRAAGLQVWYTYAGEGWCDTLRPRPDGGAQVVRLRLCEAAPPLDPTL